MLPISYKCICGYVAYGINFEELLSNISHTADNLTCLAYLQDKRFMVK
jgi:hypothetical protein